jgi:multiple sugar transport system substrate-binding protein
MQPNADYSPKAAQNVILEPTLSYFGVGGPVYDSVGNSITPALVGQVTVDQALTKFKDQLIGFDKN